MFPWSNEGKANFYEMHHNKAVEIQSMRCFPLFTGLQVKGGKAL